MLEATQHSGDGNGVECARKEDSNIKDREEAEEAVKAALGFDS